MWCAQYGYSNILWWAISKYPQLHERHPYGETFWYSAAVHNSIFMMDQFKDVFEKGKIDEISNNRFHWDDEPLINRAVRNFREVIKSVSWLRKNGASWEYYCFEDALCDDDKELVQYISANYQKCWCGKPACNTYDFCEEHGGYADERSNLNIDPWMKDPSMILDIWEIAFSRCSIAAVDYLWEHRKTFQQDDIYDLISSACGYLKEENDFGKVVPMVEWVAKHEYSIADQRLSYLYWYACGGTREKDGSNGSKKFFVSIAKPWVCKYLSFIQFLYANGCPLPKTLLTCRFFIIDVNLLQWMHFNAGVSWDVDTTIAAAEFGHYESLKFAIENGCPANAVVNTKACSVTGIPLTMLPL